MALLCEQWPQSYQLIQRSVGEVTCCSLVGMVHEQWGGVWLALGRLGAPGCTMRAVAYPMAC